MNQKSSNLWFGIKRIWLIVLIVSFLFHFIFFGKYGIYGFIDSVVVGCIFSLILVLIINYFNWFYLDDENQKIVFPFNTIAYEDVQEFREVKFLNYFAIQVVKKNKFNLTVPFLFKFNLVSGLKNEDKKKIISELRKRFFDKQIKQKRNKKLILGVLLFFSFPVLLYGYYFFNASNLEMKKYSVHKEEVLGEEYKTDKFKIIIPKAYKLKKKEEETYYFQGEGETKLVLNSKTQISNNIFYKLRHPFKVLIEEMTFPESELYFEPQFGLFPTILKSYLNKDDIVYEVKKLSFKTYIIKRKGKEKVFLHFYLVAPSRTEEVYIDIKTEVGNEERVINKLLANIELIE
ncbi:hypothetical protein [Orenia marismortui]|uniref:hypothetical protein n=1 Tax=Orenia marismortui TaxID=46469 RepID=UPI0003777E38|nr:hypothetical protein [Orenia marismortui]